MTEKTEITIHTPGYDRLAQVLAAAADQASLGKGKERHANDLPFDKQPMQIIAASHGIGFITGQASKKLEKAVGMLARGESDAAIKELLGAIVYGAGAVIFVEAKEGVTQVPADSLIPAGVWLEWNGDGACPLRSDATVDLMFGSGKVALQQSAAAFRWVWKEGKATSFDITSYRLPEGGQ